MELLKKWLDGSIKWTTEKQLRNQAQKDDFLADALEGLDAMPEMDHAQNISTLERRLQERISKKDKKISYPLRAIAAAGILLVSAGIWWNIQSNLNQTSIAETQILPKAAPPRSPEIEMDVPQQNKPAVVTTLAENIKTEEKNNTFSSHKTPPSSKELAVVQKELTTTISPTNQKAWSNDPLEESVAETPIASSITIEEVSPEVRQSKEFIAEASTLVIETADAEPSPIESEPIREELADGIAYTYEESSPAAMTEESTLRSPLPSDEGIISAMAKSEVNTSRVAKRKLIDTSKALPIGGMDAFKEYIKTNKIYPEVAKAANIQGTVLLAFKLKKNGSVKNIEVSKSLHPACDAEAIRLLKEGPKWTSPTGIGYYEIAFGLDE